MNRICRWLNRKGLGMLVLGALAVLSVAKTQAVQPRIAYIYDADTRTAEQFQVFLQSRGYATDLINGESIMTRDFLEYDLIAIGPDTGFITWVYPAEAAERIQASGKPILGLGTGASCCFDLLSLRTGWNASWVGPARAIVAASPLHPVFRFPHPIPLGPTNGLNVYASDVLHVGIYLPVVPAQVAAIASETATSLHYPLTFEQGRYFLWGFDGDPTAMTSAGQDLFDNVIHYLVPSGNPPPVILTQPVSQTARVGSSATFSVTASGDPKPTYQWRFNGTDLPGKTNATLTLHPVLATQFGSYSVAVSNVFGVVLSTEAILSQAEVIAWGLSEYEKWPVPQNVTNVIAIAAGYQHSLALIRDGTVVAWGTNRNGQCDVPPGLSGVIAIAAGDQHSLALKADGTVVAWGAGTSNTDRWPKLAQCMVPQGLSNVVAIAAGGAHSLALKANGTVIAWGAGSPNSVSNVYNNGQCHIPRDLRNVVAIEAGEMHTLALKADGTVFTLGFSDYLKVDPDWPDLYRARPAGLANVVGIAAGSYHNLVLKSDGRVAAWGDNGYDQAEVPPGLANVVALAAGFQHGIALKANGTVALCGGTYWDGTMVSIRDTVSWGDEVFDISWPSYHMVPVYVPHGLSNVVAISVCGDHNLALVGTGKPALLEAPLNRVVRPGDSALFRATASGAWPLRYQWRLNGNNLPGATNQFLFVRNARETNAGAYSVVITNGNGSLTSGNALLSLDTVAPGLSITSPTNQQQVANRTILVTGTATDAGRGGDGIASVTVNGVKTTIDTATAADTAYWSGPASLKVGNNTIRVVATDLAGNAITNSVRVTCDTGWPMVTITNLAANQRISNSVFTAMGKAGDRYGLSHVWYRLNGGNWSDAGAGALWRASLELRPGTNLFEVVGEDLAGNRSLTNRATLVCVPSGRLVVQKVGQGSIAPNYHNALLALGTNYSITATASNGHRFAQWTVTLNGNSITVGSNRLSFTMQSNLTLTAVFLDTAQPAVTITSPTANQRIGNPVFLARGSAKDNVGISAVWCRLNGTAWERAAGTLLWTNVLLLKPGTNVLEVYAEDAANNHSATGLVRVVGTFASSNVVGSLRTSLVRASGGGKQLRLVVPAASARRVGVQVSPDLVHWETLGVFTNATGTVEVPLPDVLARPQGYYRTVPVP